MPAERLTIAHVTPHSWGTPHEVNEFVENVSLGLAERGHRVLIAAPFESRARVRDARRALRSAKSPESLLFGRSWSGPRAGDDGGPPVAPIGSGIAVRGGPGPRSAMVPLDVSRTLELLLGSIELDVVHVHDPFAPSASSTALRHSRSLNVGSFHEPTERVLSTQVARPLVEIFFGRLDARTTSGPRTLELMERFFPGTYELVQPGAEAAESWWPSPERTGAEKPVRIAFCAFEERGAVRLLLRALRRLPTDQPWEAAIWAERAVEPTVRISRALREHVRFVGPREGSAYGLVAGADILVAASGGPLPAPGTLRAALASGTVPVASHLPAYDELTGDGELGLQFPPGDTLTLAGQLTRLVSDSALRGELARAARRRTRGWAETCDEVEEIYRRVAARRHDSAGDVAVRRRIARRRSIQVDLHMHTDHSPDCATPVGELLETARERGLGAIAITDHNEISGALAARDLAAGDGGLKVIVGEEVKTAEQGEVIGLFLEEKIPRGMTMEETIAEIRRQGGLVYIPHPFDRLHSVPDYEHLLKIVEEIDILEVFNPRVAFSAFNEEAERFAAKYRIVPGAGSDSHVPQGLGSVRIRLHDFDGPQEFLEAMRDADIVRKHKNLVYVQALKLIQTAGGRGGSRGTSRRARARRAQGKR